MKASQGDFLNRFLQPHLPAVIERRKLQAGKKDLSHVFRAAKTCEIHDGLNRQRCFPEKPFGPAKATLDDLVQHTMPPPRQHLPFKGATGYSQSIRDVRNVEDVVAACPNIINCSRDYGAVMVYSALPLGTWRARALAYRQREDVEALQGDKLEEGAS
jgi:hypothetical protein